MRFSVGSEDPADDSGGLVAGESYTLPAERAAELVLSGYAIPEDGIDEETAAQIAQPRPGQVVGVGGATLYGDRGVSDEEADVSEAERAHLKKGHGR